MRNTREPRVAGQKQDEGLALDGLIDAIAAVGGEVEYFRALPKMARMNTLMARAGDRFGPPELRVLVDLWDAYPQDDWLGKWQERWTALCSYLERDEAE